MGTKLDFPLVVTGTDNKALRLVCCAHDCGKDAVENRGDKFGEYQLCRAHCDEDDALAAAEHGASQGAA